MKSIYRHIVNGVNFCAIEHRGAANAQSYEVLTTTLKKGSLEINRKETLTQFLEVSELVNKTGKVHLVINNDQIIEKTVDQTETSAHNLVRGAFSSIDVQDFYYEVCSYSGKTTMFLCRKSYIDNLIESYKKNNVIVSSWSLGFLAINEVLPYIDGTNNRLITPTHAVYVENSKMSSVIGTTALDKEEEYIIGDDAIPSTFLVPFGAVLRSYMNYDASSTSNFQKDIEQQQSQFAQNRFYKKGIPIALASLLIVFLINFLIHNFYYNEVDRLEQISLINDTQRKSLILKDSVVSQKEKRFEDVISSASSTVSLFIDRLVLQLPESIVLGEISFQPVQRRIKEGKEIQLEYNVIRLSGITKEVGDISSWISYVEHLDFVESVFLSMAPEGNRANFELKVKVVER